MNLGGWLVQVTAPWMLWGLLAAAIPVLIHLLNRRRAVVIDWGAMQFLDVGPRARRRLQLTELLLMLGRMLLLALAALAVARPFLAPSASAEAGGQGGAAGSGWSLDGGGTPVDVALVLDSSESMARRVGGSTPRAQAIAWARSFVKRLPAGSAVALIDARDQARAVLDPPSPDRGRVDEVLAQLPEPRGTSDLPAAVAEALRVLEAGKNLAQEIVLLSDGQRHAWRPGEVGRWDLLRSLHAESARRRAIPPRLWAVSFTTTGEPEGPDGAVGPLEVGRGLVPAGLPLTVATTVTNAGPGPLTRTARLAVDGIPVPGRQQSVGPIPPGGRAPVRFQTALSDPGSHRLTVRLDPADDPLATNDEASRAVEVAEALPVLIVDGEPGVEALDGESDFLRAALAPTDDATPAVRATVIPPDRLSAASLQGQRVLVLANVSRLNPAQAAAVSEFASAGGGVLIAPGDRTEATATTPGEAESPGWLPAKLGPLRGEPRGRTAVAHPDPRSFNGPALGPFAQGDAPALARAGLFAYRVLEPATGSAVVARLDTGDPWIVERPLGRGRVLLLAGPLDAEGGTLPVNPDFVPWVHTLVYSLADAAVAERPHRPGESLRVPLPASVDATLQRVTVLGPDGREQTARVERTGPRAEACLDAADAPGLYEFQLPDGSRAHALVESDPRESEPEPLATAEAGTLARGWPLSFATDPEQLTARLLSAGGGGPRPLWKLLVLAALGGLCLEVFATRRLARQRGLAAGGADD